MARIRRLLTFASQCGPRSRPPARCFRLLAIPNGCGFCCGSTPERLACQSWPKDEGEKITTVSAPLKTLFAVGLVKRRHEAKHVFYALADEHFLPMPSNAIDHAAESRTAVSADPGHEKDVSARRRALRRPIPNHAHQHGPGSCHPAIRHARTPDGCTSDHRCGRPEASDAHGLGCGHEVVPHSSHTDYRVSGRLHHPHGDHSDDHRPLTSACSRRAFQSAPAAWRATSCPADNARAECVRPACRAAITVAPARTAVAAGTARCRRSQATRLTCSQSFEQQNAASQHISRPLEAGDKRAIEMAGRVDRPSIHVYANKAAAATMRR